MISITEPSKRTGTKGLCYCTRRVPTQFCSACRLTQVYLYVNAQLIYLTDHKFKRATLLDTRASQGVKLATWPFCSLCWFSVCVACGEALSYALFPGNDPEVPVTAYTAIYHQDGGHEVPAAVAGFKLPLHKLQQHMLTITESYASPSVSIWIFRFSLTHFYINKLFSTKIKKYIGQF